MSSITTTSLFVAMLFAFVANSISTGVPRDPHTVVSLCIVAPYCPCTPLVHEEIIGCKNFCDKPGQAGKQYFCCDEDQGPRSHQGTCPRTNFENDEIDQLCDDPQKILCDGDADCVSDQKCCYTADTQHRICRKVA
ncbi:uncharacterized protein [Palaemon carinicauda]|uniref:uncharacterized protein n=1 Tax=Palaemon carinicauda TaxID=392227 RepID=UPI0035B5F3BE